MGTFHLYKRNDDGRWVRWTDPPFPEATGAPKSWKAEKAAVAYAEEHVGTDWNVRPAGARYSKTQPQEPMPATKPQKRAQAAHMKATMKARGYVSDGRLPGGGEYRWTVRFPSPADAHSFARAIHEQARNVTLDGPSVSFAVGPNHWPGDLFDTELAEFRGSHPYSRSHRASVGTPRKPFVGERAFHILIDGVKQVGLYAGADEDAAIHTYQVKAGNGAVIGDLVATGRVTAVENKPQKARPPRGLMSRAEEEDARGETELTNEATTGEQRAAYEAEQAEKRKKQEWYILVVETEDAGRLGGSAGVRRGEATHDLGEGPFDGQQDARAFAEAEVGVPWVLFRAPPDTAAQFEAEKDREHEDDPENRTDWYVLKIGPRKVATVLEEGPFTSPERARTFAEAEVPGSWVLFLAPAGTAEAFEEDRAYLDRKRTDAKKAPKRPTKRAAKKRPAKRPTKKGAR